MSINYYLHTGLFQGSTRRLTQAEAVRMMLDEGLTIDARQTDVGDGHAVYRNPAVPGIEIWMSTR
jgi:hypothetical protein